MTFDFLQLLIADFSHSVSTIRVRTEFLHLAGSNLSVLIELYILLISFLIKHLLQILLTQLIPTAKLWALDLMRFSCLGDLISEELI